MAITVEKKFKSNRCFRWDADGHRVNLYINAYMNVPIRMDKFKDYIAAGLETLANELRSEAATDRGRYLERQVQAEAIAAPMQPEEERETVKDEKTADKNER